MSEENGFIDWQGGECPVDGGTLVEVKLSGSDGMPTRRARAFNWRHNNYSGNVIAYRVVDDIKPKVEIPEGFTPWAGGECPVDPDTDVDVIFDDGRRGSCGATHLRWTNAPGFSIIAYRVVETPKAQVKIPKGFTPWFGGACPVDPDTGVDVILADGTSGGSEAKDFDWSHVEGRSVNILAYRADKQMGTCKPGPANATAPDLLDAAACHLRDRADTYDKPEGERSMAKTVAIFNLHHGTTLTEAQGWHLLQILKDVRLFTRANYHADSAEDCIAYAALKAEAMAKGGV